MYAMWKRKEGRREVKKTVRRGGEEENIERRTFQVLTAASMKLRIFWDVLPCS
jgi:hypothetical protein